MSADKPCPECGGSGEQYYYPDMVVLGYDVDRRETDYGPCSVCNGEGTLSAAVAQRLEGQ